MSRDYDHLFKLLIIGDSGEFNLKLNVDLPKFEHVYTLF